MIVIDPLLIVLIYAIGIYTWVVIASVILSWLVGFNVLDSRNQLVATVTSFVWQLTEPALKPIRRKLPSFGGMDISAIALILLLWFLQMVIENIRIALHAY